MKRRLDDSASTSDGRPKSKPKFNPSDEPNSVANESAENARRVADHYSARSNQPLTEREKSPIIHLKKLNNWIKSVLVQLYASRGDSVLDLACGKGGDLIKWDKANIGYYVGVDIAEGSDAVDCPEWIVPFPVFKALADEYNLELVFAKNSHEFIDEHFKKPEFVELMRRLGALGDGNQDQSTLSQDEWDAAYLYLTFAFRKRGEPNSRRRNNSANRGKMYVSEEDIEFIGNGT